MFDLTFGKHRTYHLFDVLFSTKTQPMFSLLQQQAALIHLVDLNKPLLFIQKSLCLMKVWAISGFKGVL